MEEFEALLNESLEIDTPTEGSVVKGKVIEHARTDDMFVTPQHRETADYIEGRYG